ncbi:AraC family transcriptional regulator [Vibrio methylphosphonaticus]|uniref:AraC family transcriptional regulator n=1 Tax=Vibrio methylphosphonaticus TaxID=2946866 RepID=UPI00202A74A6|nr:AraC family transcriptional regulator [Vibrio methylphosphonaticus]MCL9773211.1 helix-turn-helix domain-containing protein [Vibrio methylphosphonaticus]
MKWWVQCVCWLFLATCSKSFAQEFPPIFYPLQLQSQGQYLPATQLYIGTDGGLWSFDVHDKVRFFDGRRFVTLDNPPFTASNAVFAQGRFWYYRDNQILSQVPQGEEQVVYGVQLTNTIRHLGESNSNLWFVDESQFYMYSMTSQKVTMLPLSSFESYHSGLSIDVSDAIFVDNGWYLATSIGVFHWNNGSLTRLKLSTNLSASTLHYSPENKQLVVGFTTGVEIYDVDASPSTSTSVSVSKYYPLALSHVLTLEESEEYYWVGTEHGLFLVDKTLGEARKVEVSLNDEYGLLGEKIYSLVSDGMSGMWIATNGGVRYFSEFSRLFRRSSVNYQDDLRRIDTKLDMFDNPLGGYWVVTNNGLYSVNSEGTSTLVFWGRVSSVAQRDKTLWLATERGLLSLDLRRYRVTPVREEYPSLPIDIEHLAFEANGDNSGTLWMSSGLRLFALDIANNQLKDYGTDWVLHKHLPAKITALNALEQQRLAVGTDHGLYLIDSGKSHYVSESEAFGRVIEMAITEDTLWAVSSYGVFTYQPERRALNQVELQRANIRPLCVTQSRQALWVITSMGVSAYLPTGEIKRHLSEPYGLINNEFVDGSCTYNQEADAIAVGSRYGMVEFTSNELLQTALPSQTVLITELTVDNQPVSIGTEPVRNLLIPYGKSVGVRFGVWPLPSGKAIEYRFDGDESWSGIQGLELNFDKPTEGKHQLYIRIVGDESGFSQKSFELVVLTPWYKSASFYTLSLFGMLSVIIGFMLWRSRRVRAINKMLKTQVSLKTEQLQHQSRVLVRNNQQLRKVFHVRQQVVRDLVQDAVDASKHTYLDNVKENTGLNERLRNLDAIFDEEGQRPAVCSVSRIINFTVKAWQQEFDYHGVRMNLLILPETSYVFLDDCNLDIIFNSVLSNALKRLVRGQALSITVDTDRTKLSVTFEDSGLPLPSVNRSPQDRDNVEAEKTLDFSPSSLPLHIHNSGGELRPIERGAVNRMVIRWNLYSANLIDTVKDDSEAPSLSSGSADFNPQTLKAAAENSPDKPKHGDWKASVTQLVSEQFNNPEFSTSSAAKVLFISERSLQRRFKSLFGVTFSDYLSEIRMEKACEMLLQGEKVADVAFSCGFNDPSYFSQRFKLYFGISPSKFASLESDESETV